MDKLYPLAFNQATLLEILEQISQSQSLPRKPYCSDNLSTGIYPRLQRIAITKRYIQLNPPSMQHWLVFDIDRPNSAYAWYDANLPTPFAVVVNESNTHCHIIYRLESPVCTSDLAHEKPLRYLDAIQRAYTAKLQADVNYSGLIAKNPFSQNHWRVIYCAVNALYTLDYLAEWVDLTQVPKRCKNASEAVALGRNCYLFDSLRKVAYKSIREYRTGKVDTWRSHILDQAMSMNVFSEPLPHSEIKGIAKSVANWTWKKMRHDTEAFKQRQSVRGKKGGIAKGAKNHNKRVSAMVLKEQGLPLTEIARSLNLTVMTLRRWKI
ncbi:replication initiation protein [Vitreoscilla stercoraria]|uniref:Replication initiation protein n=1 Tax=Vitreoscilla stercoraria TaxID=61 RepID=A0ABY4EDF6_VITST|nr:replication initiation protein [Vitreoscilla stercoraria]UOO93766.1 replication initiation protein [Vitreoscilla stercoraria]